jgi:L,D-peptidoglycan transpeptidase YkuD (ErfK/YbiS/YcfS/YnhG family)
VLIAFRLRFKRPATGFRRRSFLFGATALAAAFVVPAIVPQTASRPFDASPARASAFRAVTVLRAEMPAAARQVDRLIAQAEVVTADEQTAPLWEQSPGRVETSWLRVLATARSAVADLKLRENASRQRWLALAPGLEADVRRAQEESNEAGVGRREISAAKQASLKWDLARHYATIGAYDRAIKEAESAASFNKVVRTSFDSLHSRFAEPKNLRKWQQLVAETIARSKADGSTAIIIDKLKRKLHVYAAGNRIATFDAELGAKGLKQKLHAGDQATPEGRYRVTETRGPGRTKYYKALLLDYPNAEDRARYAFGKKSGQVPLRAGIGSLIEIHGDGGQGRDWTDGCVALTDRDMDKVFARSRVGTPVTIVGTF